MMPSFKRFALLGISAPLSHWEIFVAVWKPKSLATCICVYPLNVRCSFNLLGIELLWASMCMMIASNSLYRERVKIF